MYVAITKKVGDLAIVPPIHQGKNAAYPLECVENESLEYLQVNHPESLIMTTEAYVGYKHAMNEVFENPPAVKKPWWKIWA